jgi:glutamine synthetase
MKKYVYVYLALAFVIVAGLSFIQALDLNNPTSKAHQSVQLFKEGQDQAEDYIKDMPSELEKALRAISY